MEGEFELLAFLPLLPLLLNASCFVHGQDLKREQKYTRNNFGGFHNHSPLFTMPLPRHLNLAMPTPRMSI